MDAYLAPSAQNDRVRTQCSKLGYAFEFDLQDKPSTATFMGEYGYMWAKQFHNNKYALPSIKEIFKGLYHLRTKNLSGMEIQDQDLIDMFDFLIEVIEH